MSTPVMPPSTETPPVPRGDFGPLDLSRIAQDLQIRKVQVEAVVHLLDEGNTIPFITRYRKERTGGLDEEVLRTIQERVGQLRQLAERKQTILRTIEGQGKLTEELRAAILAADHPKRLEDLYLPYKPKKRSLAQAAREKGLERLAMAIWEADAIVANLEEVLPTLINPEQGLNAPEEVLQGAGHILAELIAETADVRAMVRNVLWDTGRLCTTKSEKLAEGQGLEYKDYFAFTEPIRQIPPHRILAINRGEKDNALTAKIEWDAEAGRRVAVERLPLPKKEAPRPEEPAPLETPPAEPAAENHPHEGHAHEGHPHEAGHGPHHPAQPHGHGHHPRGPRGHHLPPVNRTEDLEQHPHRGFLDYCIDDALNRLLVPSLEREIRRELTQRAENHAVVVFARNLRSKLLAAPLRNRRVLAIDPAFRTGCKLAVLDETGNLLADSVIFPHQPQNRRAESRARLEELIRRHQVQIVAIGNGTACRETEELVSDLLADFDVRRQQPGGFLAPPPVAETPAETPPPVAEVPPEAPAEAPAAEGTPVAPAEAVPAAELPPTPIPVPIEAIVDQTPPEAPAPTPELTAPPTEGASPSAESTAPVTSAPEAASPVAAPPAPPPPPAEPLPEPVADLAYVIVNEAGASVYSASSVGREEFPNFDATLRGTISIGRRLQDPLSELVKIDPQHVGVGLYQHDVNPRHLKESLEGIIESCVNAVGVDLNTASVPLLRHVSGMNALTASNLVEHRKNHGPFRSREQLIQIEGIGPTRYVQAAGFLKIVGGDDPLDTTWIHPESYPIARQLLGELGYEPTALTDQDRVAELQEKLRTLSPEEVAARLHVGVPTLRDILEALARPGRDLREDLPPPVFKKGILKLEDLQPGMELKGTVLNVVDFGAFIDIGLKDSGLVHISQMANRYVKSPYDVVSVGDVVNVWVLSVDSQRHRVSLTMIQPGSERRPQERGPGGPRQRREGPPREGQPREGQPREARPPRGDQPPGGHPPREARPAAAGGRPPREGGRPPREGGRPGGGRGDRGAPPGGKPRSTLPPRGTSRIGSAPRMQNRKPGQQPTGGGEGAAPPAEGQGGTQASRKPQRPPSRESKAPPTAGGGKGTLSSFSELAALLNARSKGEAQTPPPAPPPTEPPAGEPPPSA